MACKDPGASSSKSAKAHRGVTISDESISRSFEQCDADLLAEKSLKKQSTVASGSWGSESYVRGFGSIVFAFDNSSWGAEYRYMMAEAIASDGFKNAIGAVILVNALTIGLESSAHPSIHDWELPLKVLIVLEHVFLAIYVVELGLRFFAYGWTCIYDKWVKFDSVLVVSGVVINWVLPLFDFRGRSLGPLLVLRLLRLLRLARTIRLVVTVRDLWILVRSLLNSAGTIVYVILLMGLVLYVFACVGVEIITLSPSSIGEAADPDFQDLVAQHFATVEMTMLTLVQFVSLDSIAAIYTPLVWLDPTPPLLTVYFTFAFVVIGVVLMNLITAVVVNSAMEQASQDKEVMRMYRDSQRKDFVTTLKKILWRLDTDGSGTITMDEITAMTAMDQEKMASEIGIYVDPVELFTALDVDGQGILEIDNFCDSIWQVSYSQVPLEVKRTEKLVLAMRKEMQELKEFVMDLHNIFSPEIQAEPMTKKRGERVRSQIAPDLAQQLLFQEGVALQVRREIDCLAPRAGCPPGESAARESMASTASTALPPRVMAQQAVPEQASGDSSSRLHTFDAQLDALVCEAVEAATSSSPRAASWRTEEPSFASVAPLCDKGTLDEGAPGHVLPHSWTWPVPEGAPSVSLPSVCDEGLPMFVPEGQCRMRLNGGAY